MSKLTRWIYKRRLIATKRRALFEIRCDLAWLEGAKETELHETTRGMRDDLAKLRKEEQRDEKRIGELEERISEIEAIQRTWRQTKRLEADVESYVKMLEES